MARVALLDEKTAPDQADLIRQIRDERGGRLANIHRALLNSPAVCRPWLELLSAVRFKSALDARYRELAILRVASLNKASYAQQGHVGPALAAGLTQQEVDRVLTGPLSSDFAFEDRAVLEYTDAMTRDLQVPEAVMTDLRTFLDDRRIVELTVTIASYNMVSRLLEALQVERE